MLENVHNMIKDKMFLWSLSNEPNQITDDKMLHMRSAAERLVQLGFKTALFFVVIDSNGVTLSKHFERITVEVFLMAAKK